MNKQIVNKCHKNILEVFHGTNKLELVVEREKNFSWILSNIDPSIYK